MTGPRGALCSVVAPGGPPAGLGRSEARRCRSCAPAVSGTRCRCHENLTPTPASSGTAAAAGPPEPAAKGGCCGSFGPLSPHWAHVRNGTGPGEPRQRPPERGDGAAPSQRRRVHLRPPAAGSRGGASGGCARGSEGNTRPSRPSAPVVPLTLARSAGAPAVSLHVPSRKHFLTPGRGDPAGTPGLPAKCWLPDLPTGGKRLWNRTLPSNSYSSLLL